MKCGYSKRCITPKVGITLAGSYEINYSKGVIDDLFARAVAFSDGETSAVMISVDLCHMPTTLYDGCRKSIAEKTKLDLDSIIITCTHTHAGPHTNAAPHMVKANPEIEVMIKEYVEFLTERIVEAAVEATENLFPAKLYTAAGKAENVANVRRYLMKDGTTVTNPGKYNPDILSPRGEPNTTVKLLKIVREGAKDVFVVNFGMHATTVHGGTYISADYPGVVCKTIESALECECVFFQGAEGDIVQVNTFPSPELLALREKDDENRSKNKLIALLCGQNIAAEVLKIHLLAKEVADGKVLYRKSALKIPSNKAGGDYEESLRIAELYRKGEHTTLAYTGMALVTVIANAHRIIRMKNEPDFYTYYAYTLSVGDFAFVCLPGEPFTEIRNRIDGVSVFGENTVVCALTNCATQYFPYTKAFSEGGYEVATTSIGPGADEVIVTEIEKALAELKAN